MKTDAVVRQAVLDELDWDPRVTSSRIGVSVEDGVAALSGDVENYAEKLAVLHAASRAFGVRGMADELKVRLTDYDERTDAGVARSAANAIAWTTTVPAYCARVLVQNGWVTLEGEVNSQFEKDAAEASVRSLPGIVGISNDIAVRPVIEELEIKDGIGEAFERHAQIVARNVKTKTGGRETALHDRISPRIEGEEAEYSPWATPGVTEAENDLIMELRLWSPRKSIRVPATTRMSGPALSNDEATKASYATATAL